MADESNYSKIRVRSNDVGGWPFSVVRGETVYAQCRMIEHAILIQKCMLKAIEDGAKYPYE